MKSFNQNRKNYCLPVVAWLFIMSGCYMPAKSAVSADNGSKAAEWLATQVDTHSRRLYVYADYSDSRNAFTQRGVMREGSVAEPQMDEASPIYYSGITSVKVTAPLASGGWSGYYFGNGILPAGGAPQFNWGDHDAGMDLRGAEKLVFYARAENGQTASVNFFVGGNGDGKPHPDTGYRQTTYQTLTQNWQRFEISLSGVNLSYISGGFGWVTNYDSNPGKSEIIFYMDEIYFEYSSPRPDPVFPASYAPVPLSQDGYFINSVAYSYDIAMTVLALSYAGKSEQASKVADGLVFALYNDRKYSPSERGVRNGYATGNPESFPGWVSETGKKPFAKLTGFFDINSQQWWEDYYSDSYSTGNNAWVVIALVEVWKNSGKTEYLEAACTIANYIHSLKDNTNGGFRGGWEGFDDAQQKAGYVSTEHCIDIYSAFTRLATILDTLKNAPSAAGSAQFYRDDAAHARTFVLRMYDPVQGLFYTGTNPDGAINKDVYPLDVNTWGLMTFHNDPAFDAQKILSTIESRFAVAGGYDFNDDRDGKIWWEGTLQKTVVDKIMGNEDKYLAQLAFVNAAAEADGSITAASGDGLTTGIWLEGTNPDGTPKGNEWKYNKRVHTGATAWLALAQLGENPLSPMANTPVTPAVAQMNAFVRDGCLYITGIAQKTSTGVYTVDGREVARRDIPNGDGTETFICNLPGRGIYIVTAGTESWKIKY